jgi:hypothetical protein
MTGREHLCIYGFAGRNAQQTLGLLLTKQMEDQGCTRWALSRPIMRR